MQVIVMGCGRVGVSVSLVLQNQGHQVTIIDRDENAFRSLPAEFNGRIVKGVGFDLDTLYEAGIESADAFIAVSSGDNSNIISARVAREKFKINNVIARIYDPKRAEIYSRLGIPTIASVAWSTNQIMGLLNPDSPTNLWSDSKESICISVVVSPKEIIGKTVSELESLYSLKVISINRNSQSLLAQPELLIQESDRIAIAHHKEDKGELLAKFNDKTVH